jgi:hypothetical protein
MFNKSKKYDNLYLNILEIGQHKVDTGLSYNDLKNELEKLGYDFENDCVELAVKQWFYDSFCHRTIDDNPYTEFDHLENHLDCNFIMKGDSCLRLIEHKTAKLSSRAGWFSLIVSIIAILYSVFHDYSTEEPQKNNKLQDEQIIKQQKQRQTIPKTQQQLNKVVASPHAIQRKH